MKQLFSDESSRKNPMGNDTKYSRAIRIPQYKPSETRPDVSAMYDTRKYNTLVAKIQKADISDDVRRFLMFAATRHIVFNYSKIADFYANSDADVQRLMEESALVIIDMDDAIANGYVKLSDKMRQLIEEEKERARLAKEARRVLKEQRDLMNEKVHKDEEEHNTEDEAPLPE